MKKSTHEDNTYTITLTHKQLRIVERALDIYNRLCLGQIWIVAEFLDCVFYKKHKDKNHWYFRDKYCDKYAQELFGFHPGASYGIGSPEVPEEGAIAYEMEKMCQNMISKAEGHEGYSTWKQPPLKMSNEKLIEIEGFGVVKEKEDGKSI